MTRCSPPPTDNSAPSQDDPVSDGARSFVRRIVMKSRWKPSQQPLALRREKIRVLAQEFVEIFSEYFCASAGLLAEIRDDGEPRLIVSYDTVWSLSVEIDPVSGLFILHEIGSPTSCSLITADDQRLVDYVVSAAIQVAEERMPLTAAVAIDILIGRSLNNVMRLLMLRTVRHLRGDFTKAAAVLGLSVSDLRTNIYEILRNAPPFPPSLEEDTASGQQSVLLRDVTQDQ